MSSASSPLLLPEAAFVRAEIDSMARPLSLAKCIPEAVCGHVGHARCTLCSCVIPPQMPTGDLEGAKAAVAKYAGATQGTPSSPRVHLATRSQGNRCAASSFDGIHCGC